MKVECTLRHVVEAETRDEAAAKFIALLREAQGVAFSMRELPEGPKETDYPNDHLSDGPSRR